MKAQSMVDEHSALSVMIRCFSFIVVFVLAITWFLMMPSTPLSAPHASMDGITITEASSSR